MLCIVCIALLLPAVDAPFAHAAPGAPAPAQVVFAEDFENTTGDDDDPATLITAYQGAGAEAMEYTADPAWNGSNALDCNGLVVRR